MEGAGLRFTKRGDLDSWGLRSLQSNVLKSCQNTCISRIFGGSSRSLVKVMLHMVNQPLMKVRVSILQSQFVFRAIDLLDDTLLAKLLPELQASTFNTQWYKLIHAPCWRLCAANSIPLDQRSFRKHRQEFLEESFQQLCDGARSVLLSACRPNLIIDPILWLPMTHSERSRTIRWCLGLLPGGVPKSCPYHPYVYFSQSHATEYLHMHTRLCLPRLIVDPLSFLLNHLPQHKYRNSQDVSAWVYC
ncbi:uncharacterized protein BX663DRAFT_485326 [Cokeromyces recurvatus]|uniref:uncharacterized protein n=1 Tax=Cokeromyces recurvatus TaxID=90255 RepID=UPI00221E760D|nr:uncharacterized protein BX663DRAFT_485326 [Cokeromyces recurvatus]KAI7903817.1 hypothetical protein BX663DRAFT_485326 [Cokeromyces recurvatus]